MACNCDAVGVPCAACLRQANDSERAAVVAWLRERAMSSRARSNAEERYGSWEMARNSRVAARVVMAAADAIERGEHVEKKP